MVVLESKDNIESRFKKRQLELWDQLFKIWQNTQDSRLLAELIRVDLKSKAESKQIRNIKFQEPWVDLNKQ